jgi:hypothetical protein
VHQRLYDGDDNDDPSAETLTRHFDEWLYYSPPPSTLLFPSAQSLPTVNKRRHLVVAVVFIYLKYWRRVKHISFIRRLLMESVFTFSC